MTLPISTVPDTIAAGFPYQPVDPNLVAISSGWTELGSFLQTRAAVDTWWMSCSIVASVDPGIEGEVRLHASEGPVTSTPARIVSHVGPVLLGWTEIQWSADPEPSQFIRIEGRRLAGTGGGVRVHSARLLLMTSPPAAQQGGPTYPPGYDPGQQAPYPADYSTPEPYGV